MSLVVKQTNLFRKAAKRLPAQQKAVLDKAVRNIMRDPYLGELKKGDLSFLRVYKFKLNKQLLLLGYQYVEDTALLTLLKLGSHENFYRDIKKG